MSEPVRLLIVDDHPIVRDGLHGVLGSQPDFLVAGEAADGVEALTVAEHVRPDVVVMDLRMPRLGGAPRPSGGYPNDCRGCGCWC